MQCCKSTVLEVYSYDEPPNHLLAELSRRTGWTIVNDYVDTSGDYKGQFTVDDKDQWEHYSIGEGVSVVCEADPWMKEIEAVETLNDELQAWCES